MGVLTFLIFVSFLEVSSAASGSTFNVKWNYINNSNIGPWNWRNYSSKCEGSSQSPINIITGNAKYNSNLKPLVLGNYKNTDMLANFTLLMTNGAHSVHVELKRIGDVDKSPVTMIYEGTTWRFVQFHFHWGSVSTQGSEHTIDGKSYAAEMHMIHYNTKYNSFKTAVSKSDGLLVWGHLIEASASSLHNAAMEKVIMHLKHVVRAKKTRSIDLFPLSLLIPDNSAENYYTYSGSLTTPTCDETVRWVVNKNIITVSEAQMSEFRLLHQSSSISDSTIIADNFRPTQSLNGRQVEKSFDSSASGLFATILSTFIPIMVMLLW